MSTISWTLFYFNLKKQKLLLSHEFSGKRRKRYIEDNHEAIIATCRVHSFVGRPREYHANISPNKNKLNLYEIRCEITFASASKSMNWVNSVKKRIYCQNGISSGGLLVPMGNRIATPSCVFAFFLVYFFIILFCQGVMLYLYIYYLPLHQFTTLKY